MTSSKEFKQAIREGRLNDAFIIAIGNAPQLHITTWIASPNEDRKAQPRGGECLRTHVNLVEGEIINEIGEQLIGDDLYGTLQQFHVQQVTQGHQTMSENLQSLQQMFRLLAILQKQQKGQGYTPIDTWKITDTSLPPTPETNSRVNNDFYAVTSESEDLSMVDEEDEEDEEIVDNFLSLDDLDIELEPPYQEQISTQEQIRTKSAKKQEDWGDWLEEDASEETINVIGLDDMDIEQPENWQSEDWGDETEFMSNPSRRDEE
jgi:hypothetical protein